MARMSEQLRRLQALDQHHPWVWDLATAALCGAICAIASGDLDLFRTIVLVAVAGTVLFRRRYPLAALLVAFAGVLLAAVVAQVSVADLPWTYLSIWVLLFHVGLRHRHPRVVLVAVLVVVTSITASGAHSGTETLAFDEQVRVSLAVFGMCFASFLLGLQLRNRREQVATERDAAARSAVIAERSRIAQEMHDIIGHNLSVITSLANGGAVAVRSSPDDAVEAFEAIGQVSRGSVRDVRRVLSVLRQDDAPDRSPLYPQPGADELEALVDSVSRAGPEVRLEVVGTLSDLSAARQLAVYRIVQESLTNAIKHAGSPVRVSVTISTDDSGLVVSVDDEASHPPRTPSYPGHRTTTGHGIIGMRERIEALGGNLEAGPTPHGWSVRASIPSEIALERR